MRMSRLGVRPKPSTVQVTAKHQLIRSYDILLPHQAFERTFVPTHDRTKIAAHVPEPENQATSLTRRTINLVC